ncbi:hypothetical protein AAG570_000974 [Ranatra chinensis]|uniref:Uncharacterized protein n=1 Tax=Ranatra chinensis TaxID=642074 RepID=A0ABD0YAG2_9HEMI
MSLDDLFSSVRRGDEVQRSLDLLDRVLSEFDDLENANVGSEDDGYMSMNGRRHNQPQDFPPPPEEAQRIISTLLPRVSPGNSSKRSNNSRRGRLHTSMTLGYENRLDRIATAATQTTIPKTRHQRPYGWQNGDSARVAGRVPPRTLATAGERHRDANFSDDSLDEVPPPPPPPPPQASIAWEVPLDDDDALYTPGSTKVIGRRRRRSTDRSSTGSTSRLRGTEDGSCSPLSDSSHLDSSTASRHDEALGELSGTDLSSGGTYIIRKGRRKERKPMPLPSEKSPKKGDMKRCSSTFDNIKSLLREGLIEGLDDAPPDFSPPNPPSSMVRVVSMPSFSSKEAERRSRDDPRGFHELDVPLEEEEDSQGSPGCSAKVPSRHDVGEDRRGGLSSSVVNGTDTSSNEALMIELKKEYDTESVNNNNNKLETATVAVLDDPWLTAAEISQVQVIPVVEDSPKESTDESEKPPQEFKVKVEVLQHEFGPLPPSPVEEDDEYSDVLRPSPAQTPRSRSERKEPFYRCLEPPASDPLGTRFLNKGGLDHSQHRDGSSSLKTRSMDAGFSRSHRTQHSSSRRDHREFLQIPSERRTLPTELQGPSRRRTLQKRSGTLTGRAEGEGPQMQVSCSLPETPIFARGCDIPRTPHRKQIDGQHPSRTAPRGLPTAPAYRMIFSDLGTGVSLGEAMAGAELLRLAGGPGRGWYPRQRQGSGRPASVEQLDRLAACTARKPQTLPPNLSPKFFHRSPREALRRVTSLLIRKGELIK